MSKVLASFKANLKQYTMMLALVIIVLMFQTLTGGKLHLYYLKTLILP